MRTIFLMAALAVSAILCVPAQAQEETRHEVGISYGGVPNSIWLDAFGDVISSIFGEKYEQDTYVGPIGIEYFYHTSPLIGIGAVATYVNNKENGIHDNQVVSKISSSYYTLMPAVKFNWLRRDKWGMYSKLAIGATYRDYSKTHEQEKATDNEVLFNFQVSALGVEAGGQHVRGFAELGIGEQGVILGGVRYKF